VVEDASSDNEEELARVREAYFCDTKRPIPTLQHAQDIEDPNGAFFTVPAKNKNDEILFYRGPYPPPPPGPIVSYGVPNVETFNDTVKTMMRNMGNNLDEPDGFHNGRGIQVPLEPYMTKRQKEDWLEDRRLDLSPHGLGYLPLDLSSPKKYEEETDRESSDTEMGIRIVAYPTCSL